MGAIRQWRTVCCASMMAWVLMDASSAQTLDLFAQDVLSNSPELEAARHRMDAASERVYAARAQRMPEVRAFGDYGYRYTDAATRDLTVSDLQLGGTELTFDEFRFNLDDDFTQAIVGVEAIMELYTGGRRKADIGRAVAELKAAHASVTQAELLAEREAISSYLDALTNRSILALAEENYALAAEREHLFERRVSLGEARQEDLSLAQQRAAAAELVFQTAKISNASTAKRFEQLSGDLPGTLAWPAISAFRPSTPDDAAQLAAEKAPFVDRVRRLSDAATEGVVIAKSRTRPSLSFRSAYEYSEGGSDFTDESENALVGVRLSVPIFDGGRRRAGVREARERERALALDGDAAEREVRRTAYDAWQEHARAMATEQFAEQSADVAERSLLLARRAASYGISTEFELADAERDLTTARVNVLRAKRDRQMALVDLQVAVGQSPLSIGEGE